MNSTPHIFFYQLNPDHFTDLGERAQYDADKPYGNEMGHLHIHLTSPLEADLHQGYGCFIISDSLADLLKQKKLIKFRLSQCEITWEPELKSYYPELIPPHSFSRLHPEGIPLVDDIATLNGKLIASSRFVEILASYHYNHCDTIVLKGGEAAEKLITGRKKSYW